MSDQMERTARWMEIWTGHEIDEPHLLLGDLADKVGCVWSKDGEGAKVEFGATTFWVPIRKFGRRKYVTMYDLCGSLCLAMTGDDPGQGGTMGMAQEVRVRAIRQAVQKGRQT